MQDDERTFHYWLLDQNPSCLYIRVCVLSLQPTQRGVAVGADTPVVNMLSEPGTFLLISYHLDLQGRRPMLPRCL